MKALSTFRKYLRWLIWPGLALTTAGLVSGFIDTWGTLSITLLAAGLLLLLASLLLGGFGYRRFWQSRSTQAGTNAIVATISVLLILGLINFLAVQYTPQFDLTEGGLFTLSPASKTVVKNLQQPVKIVVFDASLSPNDKQLLESYKRLNNTLTYEHINPSQDPVAVREFSVSGEGREVHLAVGDDKFFVQTLGVQGLNEQDLTNKLAQLGQERNAVVYFLQGHEEFVIDGSDSGYSQAAMALEADDFTVESLNLAQTATVPSDADVVVIAGPRQAFFKPEIEALETYLNGGGSILLMVDPQTEPELDSLLTDWGISLDERLIVDTSNTGQIVGLGPAAPLVTNYGAHPISEAFNNGRSFYPLARPILIDPIDGIEATSLLLSNAQSYAELLSETGELNIDTEQSLEGPFNIGVVLTKDIEISLDNKSEESLSNSTDDEQQTDESEANTNEGENPKADASENQVDNEIETTETVEIGSDTEELEANSSEPKGVATEDLENTESAEQQLTAESANTDKEARLVVIGNATFATDGLFGQQLNGDVFLNSVTWLSNLDNSVLSIRPKEITNRRIVMTVSRRILVIIFALVVFPVVGILGAIITWLRRR